MNDRPAGFGWWDNHAVAKILEFSRQAWEINKIPEIWRRRYVWLSHVENEAEKLREKTDKPKAL